MKREGLFSLVIIGVILSVIAIAPQSCERGGEKNLPNFSRENSPEPDSAKNYGISSGSLPTFPQGLSAESSANVPNGVDATLYLRLKAELLNSVARGVSLVPREEKNLIDDLQAFANGDGSYTVAWTYKNLGDYNRDGTVDIKDITPLAQNYGHKLDPEAGWPSVEDPVIDGNGDGILDIKDVTPIAENYSRNVNSYVIYATDSPEESDPTEVLVVPAWTEDRFVWLGELMEKHLGDTATTHAVDSLLDVDGNGLVEVVDAALFSLGENYYQFTVPLPVIGMDYLSVAFQDSEQTVGVLSAPITLQNYPPVAVLLAEPGSGYSPLQVNFDASQSYDPDGEVVSYDWDLNGDGVYEIVGGTSTTSFLFENAGLRSARLRVTDNKGEQGVDMVSVNVLVEPNKLPVAVITASPTSGPAPLIVQFDASQSYDPDGVVNQYQWDFDGEVGGFQWTQATDSPLAEYTYYQPGEYNVFVQVTDNSGARAQASLLVTVGEPPNTPPVATLRANVTSGYNPLAVSFSAYGSFDPNDDPILYYWDFGDGTEMFGPVSTQHTFILEGVYRTVLSVIDSRGGIDNASVTIEVLPGFEPINLHPSGFPASIGYALTEDYQVGAYWRSYQGGITPVLWRGSSGDYVNLGDWYGAFVLDADGDAQVGWGATGMTTPALALLWYGSGESVVILRQFGKAHGVSGAQQVGYGTVADADHALVWYGTPESETDIHPGGYLASRAYGVDNGTQVGYGMMEDGRVVALLWRGTPESVINLHPFSGYSETEAQRVWGEIQVGSGRVAGTAHEYHALMWRGTPESVVDLHPSTYTDTWATGVGGNYVVGYGVPKDAVGFSHALLWLIDEGGFIDLHRYLPPEFAYSYAYDVLENGDVIGYAKLEIDPRENRAILWKRRQ